MNQYFNQASAPFANPQNSNFCPNCGTKRVRTSQTVCPACGHAQYHNPLPGVSVIVRDSNGQILVGKRRSPPHLWCLPCGFIESSENFLEAAHREVAEETGLTIRVQSVVNVVSNVIHPHRATLVIVLLADSLSERAHPGDDITEIDWITSSFIPPMEFDADRYIITEFFAGRLTEIPVDRRFAERSGPGSRSV